MKTSGNREPDEIFLGIPQFEVLKVHASYQENLRAACVSELSFISHLLCGWLYVKSLCPLSSQNHSGLVCMWGPWACACELELCWCQVCLSPHSCSHLISSFGSLHSMATASNCSLRSSWYSYGGKLMSTRIVASLSWEAS